LKITLLTAAGEEYWQLLSITSYNKLEYCLRWDLSLFVKRHVNVHPQSGERQRLELNALEECDWLWFMGADTLIMNQTLDVRNLIDDNYDFIISQDYNGINNDVVFIKNTEASKKFLNKIIEALKVLPNDQEVTKDIFKDKNKYGLDDFKFKIIPQQHCNSYLYDSHVAYISYPKNLPGTFQRGDFVLHFPGMGLGARVYEAQKYFNEVLR
jgi:hypothetical protein